MERRNRILARLAAGVLIAGAAFALKQDEGGMEMPMPKPGAEHKVLAALEGSWEAVVDMGGMKSTGSMTNEMTMGGLWLVQNYEGDMMGQSFTGLGLIGYDPAKKKYVSTWVDSMTTNLSLAEGTYDKDAKTLTIVQEGPDPMTGEMVELKQITRFKDRDHWSFTMTTPGPDGSDIEAFVVNYTRKK